MLKNVIMKYMIWLAFFMKIIFVKSDSRAIDFHAPIDVSSRSVSPKLKSDHIRIVESRGHGNRNAERERDRRLHSGNNYPRREELQRDILVQHSGNNHHRRKELQRDILVQNNLNVRPSSSSHVIHENPFDRIKKLREKNSRHISTASSDFEHRRIEDRARKVEAIRTEELRKFRQENRRLKENRIKAKEREYKPANPHREIVGSNINYHIDHEFNKKESFYKPNSDSSPILIYERVPVPVEGSDIGSPCGKCGDHNHHPDDIFNIYDEIAPESGDHHYHHPDDLFNIYDEIAPESSDYHYHHPYDLFDIYDEIAPERPPENIVIIDRRPDRPIFPPLIETKEVVVKLNPILPQVSHHVATAAKISHFNKVKQLTDLQRIHQTKLALTAHAIRNHAVANEIKKQAIVAQTIKQQAVLAHAQNQQIALAHAAAKHQAHLAHSATKKAVIANAANQQIAIAQAATKNAVLSNAANQQVAIAQAATKNAVFSNAANQQVAIAQAATKNAVLSNAANQQVVLTTASQHAILAEKARQEAAIRDHHQIDFIQLATKNGLENTIKAQLANQIIHNKAHVTNFLHTIDDRRKDLIHRLTLLRPYFANNHGGIILPNYLPQIPIGSYMTSSQLLSLPRIPLVAINLIESAFHLPSKMESYLDAQLDVPFIEFILRFPATIFQQILLMQKKEFIMALFPRLYRETLQNLRHDLGLHQQQQDLVQYHGQHHIPVPSKIDFLPGNQNSYVSINPQTFGLHNQHEYGSTLSSPVSIPILATPAPTLFGISVRPKGEAFVSASTQNTLTVGVGGNPFHTPIFLNPQGRTHESIHNGLTNGHINLPPIAPSIIPYSTSSNRPPIFPTITPKPIVLSTTFRPPTSTNFFSSTFKPPTSTVYFPSTPISKLPIPLIVKLPVPTPIISSTAPGLFSNDLFKELGSINVVSSTPSSVVFSTPSILDGVPTISSFQSDAATNYPIPFQGFSGNIRQKTSLEKLLENNDYINNMSRAPGTDANDDSHVFSIFNKKKGNVTDDKIYTQQVIDKIKEITSSFESTKTQPQEYPTIVEYEDSKNSNPVGKNHFFPNYSNDDDGSSENIDSLVEQNNKKIDSINTKTPPRPQRLPPFRNIQNTIQSNGPPIPGARGVRTYPHPLKSPEASSETLQSPNLDAIPEFLKQEPACAQSQQGKKSFCLYPHGYPSDEANMMVEKYDNHIEQLKHLLSILPQPKLDLNTAYQQLPNLKLNMPCESIEINITLSWSRDILGSWLAILQTDPIKQTVKVTTCSQSARRNGCRPLLQPRPLIAFHPEDQEIKPLLLEFPLPVACVYVGQ